MYLGPELHEKFKKTHKPTQKLKTKQMHWVIFLRKSL